MKSRRKFIKSSLLGLTAITFPNIITANINQNYDVVVIGAGAAGLAATTMDILGDTPNLDALQRTAEGLADANIQERELQERLKQRRGVTSSLIGSEGMASPELAAAEFGLDSDSSIELKRTIEQRNVPFGGQSGLLVNERGASGFGSAR